MVDIDVKLLAKYNQCGSQEAFSEIVRRYRGLVFSTILRELRNPTAADDITQSVFILLSAKAQSLEDSVNLPRWLFHTSRLLAANERRKEFHSRNLIHTISECQHAGQESLIGALINDALADLDPAGLEAIMLRFVEQYTFSEMGTELEISEDAARKRVNRALNKLRQHFADCGIYRTIAQTKGAVSTMLTDTIATAEIDGVYSRMDGIYSKKDVDAIASLLDELYTPDFHIINKDGTRREKTREELIHHISTTIAARPVEKSRVHEVQLISLAGNKAVVVVNLHVEYIVPSPPIGHRLSSEDTWDKSNGRWTLVQAKVLDFQTFDN